MTSTPSQDTTPRVIFWSEAFSPDFFRVSLPVVKLRAIGWDATASISDEQPRPGDVLVAHRPWRTPATGAWQRLAEGGAALVLDLDEDVFSARADEATDGPHSPTGRANLARNLAVATAVTVPTERLARLARQHTDAPVTVLPDCLPRELFDQPLAQPWRAGATVVGMISNDREERDAIAGAEGLKLFWSRTAAVAHFVGVDRADVLGVDPANRNVTSTTLSVVQDWTATDFHVGLAPMAGTTSDQSRSAIRYLELAARGIPVVASDTAAYRDVIEHGVDGFIASGPADWVTLLDRLVADEDLRKAVGQAARQKARGYILDTRIDEWAGVYAAAASRVSGVQVPTRGPAARAALVLGNPALPQGGGSGRTGGVVLRAPKLPAPRRPGLHATAFDDEGRPVTYFWAADLSGSGYFRSYMPATALFQAGWPVRCYVGPPGDDVGVLVAQRTTHYGMEIWRRRAERGLVNIYEIDDNPFHVDPSNPSYVHFKPEMMKLMSENIAMADAVIASTPGLADVMRQHTDAPVFVVPNLLPSELFDMPLAAKPDPDSVVIGYPGSAMHIMDVDFEAEGLKRFWSRTRKAVAHFMGVDYSTGMGVPPERSRYTFWCQKVSEYWALMDFDIGLAPLFPHSFNDSKTPLKPLELAARGVPTVASDTGPYPAYIEHGVDGFLVRHPDDWVEYLEALVDDADLRRTMGEAARAKARRFVLEDRVEELWGSILLAAAGGTLRELAASWVVDDEIRLVEGQRV